MIQIIPFTTVQNLGTDPAFTYHIDILRGGNTPATTSYATAVVPCPAAGTFRNLDMVAHTAPGSGSALVFTLLVNGVATALTATMTGTATACRSSTGVSVTVAAGDLVTIRQTVTGVAAATSSGWRGSIEFESTTTGESIYGGHLGWVEPAATRYDGIFRVSAGGIYAGLTVAAEVQHPVAAAGTLSRAYGWSESAFGGGNGFTVYVNKNGVRQDGTGGTVNTALSMIGVASATASFSLPLAAGDVVYSEIVGAATVGFVWCALSFCFTATTDGQSNVIGHRNGWPASDTPYYAAVPAVDYGPNTSENIFGVMAIGGPTAFTLRNPQYLLDVAPGSGNARVLTLRVDSADSVVAVTISGTATTGTVTAGASITDGDLYSVSGVGASTPAAATYASWAFILDMSAAVPPGPGTNPGIRPVGNGENPGGSNPTAGTLPTTFPLKFVQIRTHDGTSRYFGETLLSDNASWTAAPGKKPAKLVGVSKIRRALSNRGAFITTRFTVTLADTDRQFRALAESQMLRGAYLAVYVIDDATRRAEGTPIRLMAGIVTSHRALPGFRYELEAEDVLGHKLSEYSKQPTLPPDKFSLADFPGLDPALEGRTIPIAMGALVDDLSEPTPQGVVPALFVGYANLNTIGGVDAVCDCYIFTQCAAAGVWDMYFNPPVWSASKPATDTGAAEPVVVEVGDVVRPTPDNASGFIYRATVGGTVGATEPVWPTGVSSTVADGGATWQRSDADTPNYRLLVPDAAYGTVLVTPGKPGWTAATSQTTDYLDYNGRRYTPLFILRSHRYAKAVREGRIVITANLYGVTETSDGSGRYMDDPPRMWEWLLINYVFGRYTTGAYLTPPTLDGTYAAIDHTSVEAAVTAHDARYLPTGYVGAVLLGADGTQSTVFDELQKLCEGGDFDQGINRHGQLMLSVETATASPVLTFDSQADIEDGSYETWIESSDYANEQEHLWGRRYIQTSVVATPKPGDPLPRTDQPYGEWQSGLTRQEDSVAIANAGERVTYTLHNYVVRDDNVAESVGETLFLRNLGALREGPRMVRFTTGWQGLGTGATHLDLGSVIGLTHPERVGASATATDTCRILAIEVEPLRDRVTLECRVLATVADASLLQQWAPVTLTDVGTESDGTTTDGVSGQDLA